MPERVGKPNSRSLMPRTTTALNALPKSLAVVLAVALIWVLGVTASASAQDSDNYRVAQGLGVYLGVLPAAMVRGYLPHSPEATMHGGVPAGSHEHHIIIAIFDTATGQRVENAAVTMTVSATGQIGEHSVRLDPMAIAGTITYGAFVNFPGTDRYDIAVDITVPGRSNPVDVDFKYDHVL